MHVMTSGTGRLCDQILIKSKSAEHKIDALSTYRMCCIAGRRGDCLEVVIWLIDKRNATFKEYQFITFQEQTKK